MNQDDSTISLTVTEIINIDSRLSDDEFAVYHLDLRELVFREEPSDEAELTSNAQVNENKKHKQVPNIDLQDMRKG